MGPIETVSTLGDFQALDVNRNSRSRKLLSYALESIRKVRWLQSRRYLFEHVLDICTKLGNHTHDDGPFSGRLDILIGSS